MACTPWRKIVAGCSAGSCGATQRIRGRLRNLFLDSELKRFTISLLTAVSDYPIPDPKSKSKPKDYWRHYHHVLPKTPRLSAGVRVGVPALTHAGHASRPAIRLHQRRSHR